jgi:hypothetical protein
MSALERLAGSITEGATFKKRGAESILKHGTHDQSSHGRKGGGSGSEGAGLEYPTVRSNPELRNAIRDYVVEYPRGAGHEAVNRTLRKQPGYDNVTPEYQAEIDSRIAELDKLVELSPALTEDTVVYRGVGIAFAGDLEGKGVGASFTDNGFTSASLDRGIAAGFPSQPTGNVMEIVVPRGTKAIVPSRFFSEKMVGDTDLRKEQELILGRGTSFEILSIEDNPIGIGSIIKVGVKQ